MITLYFAPPPSANKIWRMVNGRLIKSAAYRSWLKDAAWEIKAGMELRPAIAGLCAVSLSIPRASKLSDLDNRIKPCLDALQAGGAIQNDRQIIRILAKWSKDDTKKLVQAELHEVAE